MAPIERFSQFRWLYNLICVAALIGAGFVFVSGLAGHDATSATWMAVAGGFAIFVFAIFLVVILLLTKLASTQARQLAEMRDLNELVAKQATKLESISDNTKLSDAAKSLANRENELETLRSAIRASIREQKWEAALGFVGEVEQRFGYKQEADTLREELDDARSAAIQAKLAKALEMIEKHLDEHDWVRAQGEIDRLSRALPGETKVTSLQDRLQSLKESHKVELKREWEEAVRRSDTDHAIDVLKELDQYLSPAEAQEVRNTARDVFKDKLLQVGVQFRFAVNERRWRDALNVGLELVRDFPNARMASEVREALDTLRERASQVASEQAEEVAKP